MSEEVKALNRIADAMFQQAKAVRGSVKVAEKQLALQERLLLIHEAQAGVSAQLERQLASQYGSRGDN